MTFPHSQECGNDDGRGPAPRIRETITHAKNANPSTILASPTQEEIRKAPGAGPDARRGRRVVLELEAKVEAASPRPPSWAIRHTELSAGDLGDVAAT